MKFRQFYMLALICLSTSAEVRSENVPNLNGSEMDTIDGTSIMINHLTITDLDLDMVDVAKEIKSTNSPSDNVKRSTAVVYKIFGTIHETYPDALDPRNPRVILYKEEYVSKAIICDAGLYLMRMAKEHPNEDVRTLAYRSLGFGFFEDKGVVLWLFNRCLDPAIQLDERAVVLEAVINASGIKYKYISRVAVRAWLYSADMEVRQHSLSVLIKRRSVDLEYLPDLVALYLTSKGGSGYYRKLNGVLMSCGVDEVEKYKDVIRQMAVDGRATEYRDSLLSWLDTGKVPINGLSRLFPWKLQSDPD